MARKDPYLKILCTSPGCLNYQQARGLCPKHLQRAYKEKTITVTKKPGYSVKYKVEWTVWSGIKSRCYCKTNTNYDGYGGKGIKMSDEWKNSFMAFYRDMGPRPGDDFDIDRKDPKGDYCKDNCRWHPRELNTKGKAKEYEEITSDEDLPF